MRVQSTLVGLIVLVGATLPRTVAATDRWEAGAQDDDYLTFNALRHGVVQVHHDLEGFPDQDWYKVRAKPNHSYEVRAVGGLVPWGTGGANLDVVDSAGSVLTAGAAGDDDNVDFSGSITGFTVRWIYPGTNASTNLVRVLGGSTTPWTADFTYDIEMLDTTYSVPRFNNSATQITVFLIRNASSATVDGSIFFYDTFGNVLHTEPITILRNGLLVLNTSAIGALVGQGGSAAVAHLGGYGSLAGKAVALEAATGFTFDTVMTPFPR